MENGHNITNIIKFQALWRGFRTRKWVHDTRKDFEDIFTNIQENFKVDTELKWCNSYICLPRFADHKRHYTGNARSHRTHEGCPAHTKLENVEDSEKYVYEDNLLSSDSFSDGVTSLNYISVAQSSSNTPSSEKQSNKRCNDVSSSSNSKINCSSSLSSKKSEENFPTYHSKNAIETETKDTLEVNGGTQLESVLAEHSIPTPYDQNQNFFTPENPVKSGSKSPERSSDIDPLELVETSSQIFEMNNTRMVNGVDNVNNVLTDSWMTLQSFSITDEVGLGLDTKSEAELVKMKENLSLELLWIGQAITSRKSYLQMKNGMC